MRHRPGSTTSRGRRAVAAAALALAAMTPSGASAQESQTPETVVLFIIDLSGSMNEPFDGTRTKLDVAKEAFAEAFSRPHVENAQIGLRTYGDQLDAQPPADRQLGCETDTRLVTPVGVGNRDAILQEVAGFEARGDTPIALALQEAAAGDIPEGALATVVLFSDGRDECHDADLDGDPAVGPSWGPDPCDVAREIADAGIDLRIDRIETIGFAAGDAEDQLRCIAESTGGSYHPVDTPDDVEDLPDLFGELASPRGAVRLGGEPIEGTPTADGAPALERIAAGQSNRRYTDTIAVNEERWYRIREYGPGEGHTTATVFDLPPVEDITLELRWEPGPEENLDLDLVNTVPNVPNAPSDSVRCGGCYIQSGDPHDLYWVVALRSDDPGVSGEYELELLLEGVGWGGADPGCAEGTECWYEAQIDAANARLQELEEQAGGGDQGSLRDEIEELDAELASLTDRREALEQGPDEQTSWSLPSLLAVLTLGLGAAWLVVARRAQPGLASVDAAVPTETAVIGHLDLGSTVAAAPVAEPSPTGSGGAAAMHQRGTATAGGGEVPDSGLEAPLSEAHADVSEAGDAPPEGWYRDPKDPTVLRWWDGGTWTEHARKG